MLPQNDDNLTAGRCRIGMDERFITKVYRTIAYTWALVMMWAAAYGAIWIAVNITIGTLTGIAVLATYQVSVKRVLTVGAKKPKKALFLLIFLKYFFATILLYFLCKWHRFEPIAFVGGVVLTHFAIVAKALGIRLQERIKDKKF